MVCYCGNGGVCCFVGSCVGFVFLVVLMFFWGLDFCGALFGNLVCWFDCDDGGLY